MMAARNAYLPYIDGLRAVAVLAVVIYHLHAAWLPGGFAGVDVFFVISGFIVSASVGNLDRMGLHRFLPFFYARRILRIAPALLVMLLVTTYVSALIIPEAWLSQTNQKTGLYAFFGLSNLVLARTNNDYFSPLVDFNPFTHTWSLGVEEQFYLVFPLLFFVWSYGSRFRKFTTGVYVCAFVASLVMAILLGQSDKTSAYYLITTRFWQLAAGVLLYQAMALSGRRFDIADQPSSGWWSGAAWVAAIVLLYGLVTSQPAEFPFPGAIPVVIGTLGLLGALHGKPISHPIVRVLTWRPVLYVGRMSYSLYLWHWPIYVFFRWTVGIETPWQQALAVALSLGVAALSYRYVETPVRQFRGFKAMPRLAVVTMGLLVIGGTTWAANAINEGQPHISRTRVARHANDWYPNAPDTDASLPGCAVATGGGALEHGNYITYTRVGCPGAATAPDVFAIGDSHALAFAGLFKRYTIRTAAHVSLYTNGGCPFLSLKPGENSAACTANATSALNDMLAKMKPGDILFLPSLRMPRFADQFVRYPDIVVEDQLFSPTAVAARATAVVVGKDIVDRFTAKGVHVVLEAPLPIFKSPTFRCAEHYNRSNPICRDGTTMPRDELKRLRAPVVNSLEEIASESPAAAVWDPFPVLCPHSTCSALDGRIPLFFDADHVSGYGSGLLVPSFTSFVRGVESRSATPSTASASVAVQGSEGSDSAH
jgi:peptidoglycan/LPS O-acetylase OafA/YrhL